MTKEDVLKIIDKAFDDVRKGYEAEKDIASLTGNTLEHSYAKGAIGGLNCLYKALSYDLEKEWASDKSEP